MFNQKRFTMFFITAVFIFIAFFVYIRISYKTEIIPNNIKNNKIDSASQTSGKDIIADWKTFAKYGFEFKYRPEWTVKDLEIMKYAFILTDDVLYFSPRRISPKDSLTISFSLMDNTVNKYTIDKLAGCVNSEAQAILECKDININGVFYKKVIAKTSSSEVGGTFAELDQKNIKIVTVFDNKSFVAQAKLNDSNILDEKTILAKFDSIASTFKFTK